MKVSSTSYRMVDSTTTNGQTRNRHHTLGHRRRTVGIQKVEWSKWSNAVAALCDWNGKHRRRTRTSLFDNSNLNNRPADDGACRRPRDTSVSCRSIPELLSSLWPRTGRPFEPFSSKIHNQEESNKNQIFKIPRLDKEENCTADDSLKAQNRFEMQKRLANTSKKAFSSALFGAPWTFFIVSTFMTSFKSTYPLQLLSSCVS